MFPLDSGMGCLLSIFIEGVSMYPLEWKAEWKRCLIVGGGPVALRKLKRLLAEGAEVTVISPRVKEEILSLAKEYPLTIKRKPYEEGDSEGFALVISAAGDKTIAEALQREALEKRFLYNAADFPEYGNVTLPARFQIENVEITISTGGSMPGLSTYLRKRWEGQLTETSEEIAFIKNVYREIMAENPDLRKVFWDSVRSPEISVLIDHKEWEKAREAIINAAHSMGNQS